MDELRLSLLDVVDYAITNGGGTFKVNGECFKPINRKTGYAVSLFGYETRVSMNYSRPDVIEYIWAFIDKNYEALREAYLGLWVDGDELVLDVTIIKRNKTFALLRGKLEKQRAIYDIMRNKSLFIDSYGWLFNNVIVYERVKYANESITGVDWLSRERLNKCNASIVTINSNEGLIKAFKSYDTTIFVLINNTLYFNRLNYSMTTYQHIRKFIDKYILNIYDVKQLHRNDWLNLHDVLGLYSQYPPRVEYEPVNTSCFILLDHITSNR